MHGRYLRLVADWDFGVPFRVWDMRIEPVHSDVLYLPEKQNNNGMVAFGIVGNTV
jgi:hypothetical protein